MMSLRSFLKRGKRLKKFWKLFKKKEETTQLIEVFKVFLKNRNSSNFAERPHKKEETPKLNEVFRKTETPQKFCRNTSIKRKHLTT